MRYKVDLNIVDAVNKWHEYALPPGSCTEYLLRGDYDRAFKSAHPLIKPFWKDHIAYIELEVPEYCRGENYDTWKGYDDYLLRVECRKQAEKTLYKDLFKL